MSINSPYRTSDSATLGVELELQLTDRGFHVPAGLKSIQKLENSEFYEYFKAEFFSSMVEIVSPVFTHVDQVAPFFQAVFRSTNSWLKSRRLIALAAGTHPFLLHKEATVTQNERYHDLLDELQAVLRRFIICGMHIHASVSDGEKAIKASNLATEFLSVFLAMTASSPFFEGENTGLKAYRSIVFASLPRSGVPEHLGSYQEYEDLIATLHQCNLVHSYNDVWWDLRIRPDLGTLELRACDAVNDAARIQAVAAFYQALCHSAHRFECRYVSGQIHRQNKWAAVRHGLEGSFISRQGRVTIREMGLWLLDQLEKMGAFAELETQASIPLIRKYLYAPCPADRILDVYDKTGSLEAVAAFSRIGGNEQDIEEEA